MKRLRAILLLALVIAVVATACGGSGGASGDLNLVKAGTLTVCSEIPYEPFEFEQNGAYVGFDVDVMQAIADQLGLPMEFVATGFDAITSGAAMAANQCDIAASAITITPEREQNIDFSDPYYNAAQSLLVKKDSGIKTLADFAGKRLGVQSGTTGEAYAQENAPATAELVGFEAGGELFVALEAGDIEGILQDLPVNADRAKNDSTVEVIEQYDTGENYGFAVQETGKEALLTQVNDALKTIRDNGTYDTIYQKWFG
jgi:polar amino acid transport system substrate-binding protein